MERFGAQAQRGVLRSLHLTEEDLMRYHVSKHEISSTTVHRTEWGCDLEVERTMTKSRGRIARCTFGSDSPLRDPRCIECKEQLRALLRQERTFQ